MDNSDPYIEMAATEKLRYAIKVKQVNDELLEHLASSLRWVLHYCAKNNLPLPEKEKIDSLIDRAIEISQKYPQTANFGINRNFTGRRSTDDYTEPPRIIFLNNFSGFCA